MELGKPQHQGGRNLFSAPLSNRTKQAVSYSPSFPAFPSNAFALFSLGGFKTPNIPLSHIALGELSLVWFLGCHQLISYRKNPYKCQICCYIQCQSQQTQRLQLHLAETGSQLFRDMCKHHSHRIIPGIILQDHLLPAMRAACTHHCQMSKDLQLKVSVVLCPGKPQLICLKLRWAPLVESTKWKKWNKYKSSLKKSLSTTAPTFPLNKPDSCLWFLLQ